MFIIECAVVWMLYDTEVDAKQDLEAHRDYYNSNKCDSPSFVDRKRLDFVIRISPEDYRSGLAEAETKFSPEHNTINPK